MLQKPEISAGLMSHLARMQALLYPPLPFSNALKHHVWQDSECYSQLLRVLLKRIDPDAVDSSVMQVNSRFFSLQI